MAINNLAALEERSQHLNQVLAEFGSPNFQLIELTNFLSQLLTFNNNSLLSAYFTEFFPKYLTLLKNYSPFGIDPLQTESIYSTAEKYFKFISTEAVNNELSFSITKIKNQFDELKKILEGGTSESSTGNCLQFPVLEKSDNDKYFFGFLETITISISKRASLTEGTFVVVPDFGQSDNRLNQQIQSSWDFAKNYFAGSIKASKHFHEVVIRFNKKYGIYEGSSFGIALTIGFIQELIRFYNLRDVVKLGSNIASTGSVNEKGEIDSVGVESIEKKVEAVFYSKVQRFIIPSSDLATATKRLNLLHKKYPKRELEIIGIPIISDLIDRRSLVSIKKQNIIKWGAKKTLKNKLSFALLILLIFISSYFLIKDYDDNPVDLIFKEGTAVARNKYGKILWEIDPVVHAPNYSHLSKFYERYYKIDKQTSTGKNDIYACCVNGSRNLQKLDYKGNVIWEYEFKENVKSDSEIFQDIYAFNVVVGIINSDNTKDVIAIAQQNNYYPNAVIKLNTDTGMLADSIFWHPGGITGAFIEDVDGDGRLEFVGQAISNGYRCLTFFCIEYDKLIGTAPAPEGYRLNDYNIADFDWYILIPKSDLGAYKYDKYNMSVNFPQFREDGNYFHVPTIEGGPPFVDAGLYYKFAVDLNSVEIVIGDDFTLMRDKLITQGKLKKPYSDTKEYREILKRQLLQWNGKEFVQMFPQNVEMNEGTISIQNK